jgi:hypothetical protein
MSGGIYIASKTTHANRWKELRAAGHPIISTWIDEAGPGETSDFPDLWTRCIDEASACDALIVYCEDGETLKGAWVEVGAALALNRPVLGVGVDAFTVRHHPGLSLFDDFDEALAAAIYLVNQARDDDGENSCFACAETFAEGDLVYYNLDGGYLHVFCCGPERDSFFNDDEGALEVGDPIPRPLIWTADEKRPLQKVSDEVNDGLCVDRFAMEMKVKLAKARAKGRRGWDDPKACTIDELSEMLREHVSKRDPLDVANFAMMIHQRGGSIGAPVASLPGGFCWINQPITVTGGDYTYQGQLLCSFPKDEENNAIRYIVRDQNRRLFIHNAQQCGLEATIEDAKAVPCPCTMIEQDDCTVGYPSMLCGICNGTGNAPQDQVTALAVEMVKIASDMGEPEDPFAAWESVSLVQSHNKQMRKALDKIAGLIDDETADFDEAITIATDTLTSTATEGSEG